MTVQELERRTPTSKQVAIAERGEKVLWMRFTLDVMRQRKSENSNIHLCQKAVVNIVQEGLLNSRQISLVNVLT